MRFERNVEVFLVCRDYSLGKFTACRLKRKFKWRVKYASYLPLIEVAQKSAIFKPRSISPFARWSNETLVADANCRLFLASVIEKSINNGVSKIVNNYTMSLFYLRRVQRVDRRRVPNRFWRQSQFKMRMQQKYSIPQYAR